MDKIAIIPARGGSKRLHRKNIISLQGRPLLHYPIKAAINSRLFDQVLVSTEDEEIAETAAAAGASVIKRPASLATDTATVIQTCIHALDAVADSGNIPRYFCCIYPTAVFIKPSDLCDAFDLMCTAPKADFVMGVSTFNLQPFQALVKENDFLTPMWPHQVSVQSQAQPSLVASNGTIYWARSAKFLELKTFYGKRLKGFSIDRWCAIDLDTPEDYKIVEILAPHIFGRQPAAPIKLS